MKNRIIIASCVLFASLLSPVARAEAETTPTEFRLEDHGFAGVMYAQADHRTDVGVVVFGGAEGGVPSHLAAMTAEAGYPTLAVAYFRAPDLPTHLDMIPLEPSLKAIEWMHDTVLGGDGRVVLLGGSKGAELALLIASIEPRVAGVIAYSPSHVVFQGIPEVFWPPRSSWTHRGEALPFVPYRYGPHFQPLAEEPDFLALYRESLSQRQFVDRAAIPVENVNGPVLLFSGRQDRMWPAADMAKQIIRRLEEHKHPHSYWHHLYEDAGHVIAPDAPEWTTRFGGTVEANREAGDDAQKRVLALMASLAENEQPNAEPAPSDP